MPCSAGDIDAIQPVTLLTVPRPVLPDVKHESYGPANPTDHMAMAHASPRKVLDAKIFQSQLKSSSLAFILKEQNIPAYDSGPTSRSDWAGVLNGVVNTCDPISDRGSQFSG